MTTRRSDGGWALILLGLGVFWVAGFCLIGLGRAILATWRAAWRMVTRRERDA